MNPQSAGREPVGRVESARPIRRENPPRPAKCVSAPTCGRGRADQGARPEKRATAHELWLRVAFRRFPQFGPSVGHVAAHSAPHRRFYRLGRSRAPAAAADGRLEVVSPPERCARVSCREAGSSCKSTVTEFTHPTACPSSTGPPTRQNRSPRSGPHSKPASRCSTRATTTRRAQRAPHSRRAPRPNPRECRAERQVRAHARPRRIDRRQRPAPTGGQELPRLHTPAAGDGLRRHLPAGTRRSRPAIEETIGAIGGSSGSSPPTYDCGRRRCPHGVPAHERAGRLRSVPGAPGRSR
jgi:hypothetical protein